MATDIEVAIGLVKQAIDQDKKKNFEEAARCYREALIVFKTVARYRGISKGVKQAIAAKCVQYEERLKKLDKYLLANTDLSQLFKDVCPPVIKRPDSQNSSNDGSISSETWRGLKNCPLYRQGIEAVERGKKRDKKGQWQEALHFYQEGMNLLLEAVQVNQEEDPNAEDNNEHVRFHCLLLHERIQTIRSHLDGYLPSLKPINEHSLKEDNNMSPGKNEDEDEEESILRSEELTGSTHSLNSGFKLMQKTNSMSSLKLGRSSPRNDTPQSIPLADLDNELKISDLSLVSAKSLQSIKSYHGSIKALHNESSYTEADRNVTEVTITNSELDLDTYLTGQSASSPVASSDSGISSDLSPKNEEIKTRSTSRSSIASSSKQLELEEAILQVHQIEDGTPVVGSSPSRSSPPPVQVKMSPSASLKRQAQFKAMADELTVLSQEDVVDTSLMIQKKPIAASKAQASVPPRAYAGHPDYDDDGDEDFNKGCYYFIACLDAFWIL